MSECDIEGADSTTDGGCEWAFDADEVGSEVFECLCWEPLACFVECFFASERFVPFDCFFAVVGLLYGGVKNFYGSFPDIWSCAIAFDEGDDWVIGDLEARICFGDWSSVGGGGHF